MFAKWWVDPLHVGRANCCQHWPDFWQHLCGCDPTAVELVGLEQRKQQRNDQQHPWVERHPARRFVGAAERQMQPQFGNMHQAVDTDRCQREQQRNRQPGDHRVEANSRHLIGQRRHMVGNPN